MTDIRVESPKYTLKKEVEKKVNLLLLRIALKMLEKEKISKIKFLQMAREILEKKRK